jgi:hypothetical protein
MIFYAKKFLYLRIIHLFLGIKNGNINSGTVLKNSPEIFPIINTPVSSRESYFVSYFYFPTCK